VCVFVCVCVCVCVFVCVCVLEERHIMYIIVSIFFGF